MTKALQKKLFNRLIFLRCFVVALGSLVGVNLMSVSAIAALEVTIAGGQVRPILVSVTPFYAEQPTDTKMGMDVAQVIGNDLSSSGLFNLITPATFPQSPQALAGMPNMDLWKPLGMQALVFGAVKVQPGQVRVEFRLYDVILNKQMAAKAFTLPLSDWRKAAHKVSDAVYEALTGEKGYFNTKIVYVSQVGNPKKPSYKLMLMDQDGANIQELLTAQSLAVPTFSPDRSKILYTTHVNKVDQQIFVYDIPARRSKALTKLPSGTFGARFSPDGQEVAFSMAIGGNVDIMLMDLRTGQMRNLTNYPAISTAPTFSPDGTRIAFESDRTGKKQIYVVDKMGSEPKRITFNEGRYGTPAWSPKGDYIAFTREYAGRFFIGIINPDKPEDEKILDENFMLEGPKWAPNGRTLVYYNGTRRDSAGVGTDILATIDISSLPGRPLPTRGNVVDPDWSTNDTQ